MRRNECYAEFNKFTVHPEASPDVVAMIRNLRLLALILAALTVGMKLAHLLELAPKLQWDASLYFPVQTTLYRVFGVAGPVVDFGAIGCLLALTILLRGRMSFPLTTAALAGMVVSVAIWLVVVAPANGPLTSWTAARAVPPDWIYWRARWQFGQAACFVFDFAAFVVLSVSILRETPRDGG